METKNIFIFALICCLMCSCKAPNKASDTVSEDSFVTVRDGKFYRNGQEYHYQGTNMWYAAILGSEGQGGNRERLTAELDDLKAHGIENLRVLVGAEGQSQRSTHIWPCLQPEPGVYNDTLLQGLDFLMAELERRDMTAILFLNNAWEWSGGFGIYLEWTGMGEAPESNTWNEFQQYHSQFTKNEKAMQMADDHVRFIVSRTNTITGKPYTESPALMAWELCNEPRPFANDSLTKDCFANWIGHQAKLIKSLDPNHLVTTGSEGYYGCSEDTALLRRIHAFPEIDYCCIHIWPHNWTWLGPCIGSTSEARERNGENAPERQLEYACQQTKWYVDLNYDVLSPLGKPIVLEEFGYPRDNYEIAPGTPTTARDGYYKFLFDIVKNSGKLAACNFWGWGGSANVTHDRWQRGDDYVSDPAQEEQGLYSVFKGDTTFK